MGKSTKADPSNEDTTLKNSILHPTFFLMRLRARLFSALLAPFMSAPVFAVNALAPEPRQVCFLYATPVGETGWAHQHELGRKALSAPRPARSSRTPNWTA
jgi:hypothetical protein